MLPDSWGCQGAACSCAAGVGWDGGHKANVEVVQGKTVKQNWEFGVVLISKHL